MTTRQRRRERGHVAELARNGAHLAALSALAFQQAILDILGKNAAFFAVRGSSSTEIVLFALALTALSSSVAAELRYLSGYPWATG